jgi:hypothetical protein
MSQRASYPPERVTSGSPCVVCQGKDDCWRRADGQVGCMRQEFPGSRELVNKDGRTQHVGYPDGRPDEGQEKPQTPAHSYQSAELATPEQRNKVYSKLLGHLTLSKQPQQDLLTRGFTAEQVKALEFGTLTRSSRSCAKQVCSLFPFWESVPGFYADQKARPSLGGPEGLVIPCRDLSGNVLALSIRADSDQFGKYLWISSKSHGGPSPGAPASFWKGTKPDCLRITEGHLKAALSTCKTEVPALGAAGVRQFARADIRGAIQALKPSVVHLAPDADVAWNADVNQATRRAIEDLAKFLPEDVAFFIDYWGFQKDGPKGIDDALQAGLKVEHKTPKEYLALLPVLVDQASGEAGIPDRAPDPRQGIDDALQQGCEAVSAAHKVVLKGLTADKTDQILETVQKLNQPTRVFVWKPTGKIADLRQSGQVNQCGTPEALAHLLEHQLKIRFWGINSEGQEKPIDAPEKPLKRILGMPAEDTGLPAITEFLDTPVLAEDGQLILSPGLHPSGSYLRDRLQLPPIPDAPTPEQVAHSLAELDALIADFPFEGPEDRQAWFSYLLTGFIAGKAPRPWPLWNFSAPLQGSGKGLLASLPAWISQSEGPGVISIDPSEKDPEIRKKLTALLDSSLGRVHILDNITGHLRSGALEAFLTSTVWTDRILGGSKMGTWVIKVILAITGNNLTLSPDLERRQILVRLIPDTDKPWTRSDFAIPDLVAHVRANRSQIIWHILVLVQRWVSLGFPQGSRRLGSFEGWSSAIGGLLDCVGIGSQFLASSRVPIKEDPWQTFIQLWADSHLDKLRQPASELVRFTEKAGIQLVETTPAYSLGRKLAKQVGRVFSVEVGNSKQPLRLTNHASGRNTSWSLVEVTRSSPATDSIRPACPAEPVPGGILAPDLPRLCPDPLLDLPRTPIAKAGQTSELGGANPGRNDHKHPYAKGLPGANGANGANFTASDSLAKTLAGDNLFEADGDLDRAIGDLI